MPANVLPHIAQDIVTKRQVTSNHVSKMISSHIFITLLIVYGTHDSYLQSYCHMGFDVIFGLTNKYISYLKSYYRIGSVVIF